MPLILISHLFLIMHWHTYISKCIICVTEVQSDLIVNLITHKPHACFSPCFTYMLLFFLVNTSVNRSIHPQHCRCTYTFHCFSNRTRVMKPQTARLTLQRVKPNLVTIFEMRRQRDFFDTFLKSHFFIGCRLIQLKCYFQELFEFLCVRLMVNYMEVWDVVCSRCSSTEADCGRGQWFSIVMGVRGLN